MSVILALIVLVLGFFSIGQPTETSSGAAVARPVPAVQDGAYLLPPGDAVVIYAHASNGSVPPEYQTEYEISIDASGSAVVVERPPGWAASPPTAEERAETVELGEAGLQQLLADLDAAGFFAIPPADASNEPPPGADTSNIVVSLADGKWRVQGGVAGRDRGRLDTAQRLIADAVGFAPPDELAPS